MGTLTRRGIARYVSGELGFSVRESQKLVDMLLGEICLALKGGAAVKIVKFGIFRPVEKSARMGMSPVDGKPIEIPPRKAAAFRPSRILKAVVNGEQREEILPDRRGQQADRS